MNSSTYLVESSSGEKTVRRCLSEFSLCVLSLFYRRRSVKIKSNGVSIPLNLGFKWPPLSPLQILLWSRRNKEGKRDTMAGTRAQANRFVGPLSNPFSVWWDQVASQWALPTMMMACRCTPYSSASPFFIVDVQYRWSVECTPCSIGWLFQLELLLRLHRRSVWMENSDVYGVCMYQVSPRMYVYGFVLSELPEIYYVPKYICRSSQSIPWRMQDVRSKRRKRESKNQVKTASTGGSNVAVSATSGRPSNTPVTASSSLFTPVEDRKLKTASHRSGTITVVPEHEARELLTNKKWFRGVESGGKGGCEVQDARDGKFKTSPAPPTSVWTLVHHSWYQNGPPEYLLNNEYIHTYMSAYYLMHHPGSGSSTIFGLFSIRISSRPRACALHVIRSVLIPPPRGACAAWEARQSGSSGGCETVRSTFIWG